MNNLSQKSALVKTISLMAMGVVSCGSVYAKQDKLNVIFLLTDDQGYGDLSCTGNPWLQTPNFDKLHGESVRFTNFHAGTTSAPTRSGLMTGKFGNSTGVWHTIMGRSYLDLEEVTLAEAFSHSGYSTAIFGKWHLGDGAPYRPHERGFDTAIVHGGGGVGQSPDYWANDYFDDHYFHNGKAEKYEGYCTDVFFGEALKFIKKSQDDKKPFFCYLAVNAPHFPYHVEEEYAAPFKEIAEIPNPGYMGMVVNLDENLGKLRSELVKMGLDKNTVVVFMSDNGGYGGLTVDKQGFLTKGFNAGMRGRKAQPYEGGHRVPLFVHLPDAKKSFDVDCLTSYMDCMPTLIDICGLEMPKNVKLDGVSLYPLIKGNGDTKLESRVLCVDTQRADKLTKYKEYCVMQDKWRFINGVELYDLTTDPEQRTNLIDKYPEKVEFFKAEYEKWWVANSVRENDYQYISVHKSDENVISTHDLHVVSKGMPTWDQELVRLSTRSVDGFWTINIPSDGKYRFELMRWPPETNLGIYDVAPAGGPIPNGKPYREGLKHNMTAATLTFADKSVEQQIKKGTNPKSVDFELDLKEGDFRMEAKFVYPDRAAAHANYVRITKLK